MKENEVLSTMKDLLQARDKLCARCYDETILILRNAVQRISPLVSSESCDEDSFTDKDEPALTLTVESFDLSASFDDNQILQGLESYAIYGNALSLPVSECLIHSATRPQDLSVALSATLLYNLALALHLRGLQYTTRSQEVSLRNASRIYTMAMTIVEGYQQAFDLPLLSMAIAYNLGHIRMLIGENKDSVDQCLDVLRYSLQSPECELNDLYVFFHMNVVLHDSGYYQRTIAAAA